jgi:histidinol phosphatase-like PHP family hydrolase
MGNEEPTYQCNQDLHIHTVFSVGDNVVSEEQTMDLIYKIKHAKIIGISDHFEYIGLEKYEEYRKGVLEYNFKVGTEVGGKEFVKEAAMLDFDYYLYHCFDSNNDYKGIDTLLNTGKPVIIAHPQMTDTRLSKIPPECYLEINNRYVFKYDWYSFFKDYIDKFNFIISSDAHQPHWLNQNAARYVARQLGIKETILFTDHNISDVANS